MILAKPANQMFLIPKFRPYEVLWGFGTLVTCLVCKYIYFGAWWEDVIHSGCYGLVGSQEWHLWHSAKEEWSQWLMSMILDDLATTVTSDLLKTYESVFYRPDYIRGHIGWNDSRCLWWMDSIWELEGSGYLCSFQVQVQMRLNQIFWGLILVIRKEIVKKNKKYFFCFNSQRMEPRSAATLAILFELKSCYNSYNVHWTACAVPQLPFLLQ